MNVLDSLHSREDLLKLDRFHTDALCKDIRTFLVEHLSQTGGHLASNLGVVELTVAIHKVFDLSKDRLVFDVGHQSYVHKILTGRKDRFDTLRQFGGISGFPKPCESDCDAFVAGHASNAVSVALGMARARTLKEQDYSVLALMGDGALTGGLAYEGLNDAGESGEPLIVILNDNGMSITPNVGGIARHLSRIRTRPGYYQLKKAWRAATKGSRLGRLFYRLVHSIKEALKRSLIGSNLFEEMGFEYIGPADGHDVERLVYLLQHAKELKKPVVLHVITQKGKGYAPAEATPDRFHGIGKFDPATGQTSPELEPNFSDTFGKTLVQLAAEDSRVCAITAAMQNGTGLDEFAAAYPRRFFDVGIAEGHAVSMAGGLAKQGMLPVVAVYSTFLQRAFDMILQDTALMHLHVVFAVDRAGLVGNDGDTHQGEFDVGFLRQVPGMTVLCPADQAELAWMLRKAVFELSGPVAVRYPKGGDGAYTEICPAPVIRQGRDMTLVCYGTMVNHALQAAEILAQKGFDAEIIKLNSIKPLDIKPISASVEKTGRLIVVEETAACGCVGTEIVDKLTRSGVRGVMRTLNLGDRFIPHGSVEQLYACTGLDGASIARSALEVLAE